MAERKLRRRKAKPLEEAIQFSLLRKDRTGLECTFINDIKGELTGLILCTFLYFLYTFLLKSLCN